MNDLSSDEPLQNRSARNRFEWLHSQLRDRICSLEYEPGTRLSEEALAEEFGISRTPLRRVLWRLEDEGLLRSVHGVGTLVTDVDTEELGQVYRLRMGLAELMITLDPVAPDAALLGEFRKLRDRSQALRDSPSPEGFTDINRDVFLALLRLTENEPLREISERLYFRTARIWLKSLFESQIDLVEEIDVFGREIADILAALDLGDVAAVWHLRRAHISMSFERLKGQQS